MKALMKKFWKDETGLEMVEYAVMAGLIVVGIVAVVALLGETILGIFTTLESTIDGANTGGGGG